MDKKKMLGKGNVAGGRADDETQAYLDLRYEQDYYDHPTSLTPRPSPHQLRWILRR